MPESLEASAPEHIKAYASAGGGMGWVWHCMYCIWDPKSLINIRASGFRVRVLFMYVLYLGPQMINVS